MTKRFYNYVFLVSCHANTWEYDKFKGFAKFHFVNTNYAYVSILIAVITTFLLRILLIDIPTYTEY